MTYDEQFKEPIALTFEDKIKYITKMEAEAAYIPANVHVMKWNIVVNKKKPVYAVCLESPNDNASGGKVILFYESKDAFKAADILCEKYKIPMTMYNVERS